MERLSTGLNFATTVANNELTEHLLFACESGNIGVWSADLKAGTSTCNPCCVHLFNETDPRKFDLQQAMTKRVHSEDFDHILQSLDAVTSNPTHRTSEATFRLANVGQQTRWLKMVLTSRFVEGESEPSHLTAIFTDITNEVELGQHNERLVREIQHRVKNILSVVQSVAYQSFRHDIHASALFSDFQGRLRALAKTQDLLVERRYEGATFEELLGKVISSGAASMDQFRLRGFDMHLGSKQSVSMAIALHELLTNAQKYGALSVPSGQVSVTWERNKLSEMNTIEWIEYGGPTVLETSERGFGTRMIERTIALEFGGAVSLELDPEGVRCKFTMPSNSLGT